jgi:CRP-like cAMP-binding protein
MLEQQSVQPHPKTRFVHQNRIYVAPALSSAKRNHLLAALPRKEYERLLLLLELVPLPLGEVIYDSGEKQKYLYFLISGVATKQYITVDGASTGCGLTGREGVIGISIILGGESTPCQMQMLSAGYAYRLSANQLKHELEHSGELMHLLLLYTQGLLTQTTQVAVCNRLHSVEQKLCHWILSYLDRLPSNELMITQARIADMLGVRRESVTEAAGVLQRAELIDYSRGRIVVAHRHQLEVRACECYTVVKREYSRLLPQYPHAKLAYSNSIS